MKNNNLIAISYAFLAAVFYAVNVPLSKLLLASVPTVFMAAFLYIGAGLGVGAMYLFHFKREDKKERLSKSDVPYTLAMVALDILVPILLMIGVKVGSSSAASLLGNFEIVATTLIALLLFKEKVGWRLWAAIALITAASIVLSFDGSDGISFSLGSLLVLGATLAWGFENNCTRRISEKSTYQIVTIKGFGSGLGSLAVALITGERFPDLRFVPPALILGFIAYGLSIFTYIRAQKMLGAAKTSAYYALAPFIGSFLAFILLGERLSAQYALALSIMILGTAFIVCDTLLKSHAHEHTHTFTHTHGGTAHTHIIVHSHEHSHFVSEETHSHHHSTEELEKTLSANF